MTDKELIQLLRTCTKTDCSNCEVRTACKNFKGRLDFFIADRLEALLAENDHLAARGKMASKRCAGIRCPMQVGYRVELCNQVDCPYRTEPVTNADRIRVMSDEALAWELMTWRCEAAAKYHGVSSEYPDTQKKILEWLKRPCGGAPEELSAVEEEPKAVTESEMTTSLERSRAMEDAEGDTL